MILNNCSFIGRLTAEGKTIFGGGLLLSEKAAAEAARRKARQKGLTMKAYKGYGKY